MKKMKKHIIKCLLFVGGSLLSVQIFAVNLLQVYQQGLISDPSFKAAKADWLATRENIGISRAGLLPALDLAGALNRERKHNTSLGANSGTFYDTSNSYGLTVTQPIFSFAAWTSLSGAKASAKSAEATYSAAAQDLMLRVAKAYFNVLQAYDDLRFTQAEKKSIGQQLEQTRQRFKVGLIAITDVYDAQANYDTVVAEEIAARNDLANKQEELREITGEHYKSFAKLKASIPLLRPDPIDIDQWVHVAQKQNYTLLSARLTGIAARENIKTQAAARFPTLNAKGGFAYSYTNNASGIHDFARSKTASLGLALDFPAYQGGAISAKTRQAEYQYQQADAKTEQALRSIISQTRQAYLGVLSSISQIDAGSQAIVSAESALKAAKAAYVVGTRTMVDVLNAQTKLYEAQKNYAAYRYNYILESLTLKQAAGTLSADDLQQINDWLAQNVRLNNKKIAQVKVSATSIKNIPGNHYTIQLIAFTNLKDINAFIAKNKLAGKVRCFRYQHNGKNYISIIYGDYASYAKAKNALAKLPQGLQKLHPWARSYAGVHVLID